MRRKREMTTDSEVYNIVVLGAMNPRLHHPSWYRLVGLLNEGEEKEATSSQPSVCTPFLAQFQAADLKITCQMDRWEVQTGKKENLDRLKEISIKVFDDLLTHTPISRLGFNFVFQIKTRAENAALVLAAAIAKSSLDFRGDGAETADLFLRRNCGDHTVLVAVRPGSDQASVSVASNYEYTFNIEGFFKIGDLLLRRFDVDRTDAEEQTQLIVEAINRLAGR